MTSNVSEGNILPFEARANTQPQSENPIMQYSSMVRDILEEKGDILWKEDMFQLAMNIKNSHFHLPIEDIRKLFWEILLFWLSDIHENIHLRSEQVCDPIEAACYLDNAFAYLEDWGQQQTTEYKILLLWRELFHTLVGRPQAPSFENDARFIEQLYSQKNSWKSL